MKKVIAVFIFFLSFVSFINASVTNVIDYKNPDELCDGFKNNNVKVKIYSFYKNGNVYDVPLDSNECTNSAYFSSNLSNKTSGEDYNPWTFVGRLGTNTYSYVEGVKQSASEYGSILISNNLQSYTNNKLSMRNTIKYGEKIYVDIDVSNKNISSSNYGDLRITLDSAWRPDVNSAIDILYRNSIGYYVIDTNNTVYGPYRIEYFNTEEYIQNIENQGNGTMAEVTKYRITSSNLLDGVPSNKTIKTLRIVPYDFYNRHIGYFRLYNLSINAYKNEVYSETRSTVSVSNADSVVRHNMTDKMVSLATVKWKMAPTNGKTLYFYDSLNKGNPNEYAPSDTIRYGLPYVNTIESTLYAFTKNGSNKSTLDGSVIYNYQLPSKYKKRAKTTLGTYVEEDETISGNLYVHESGSADSATSSTRYQKIQEIAFVPNDDYFYGVDCSSSMYYAQGTELPIITNMAGAQRFTSDIEVKALNGVDINFSDFEDSLRDNNTIDSEHGIEYAITNYFGKYVKSKNSTQKILESYALAVPGDVIAKTGSESHTRMISGYPYIECNDGTSKRMSSSTSYTVGFCDNHGGINATNSYIITTELSGRGFNPYKEANASSGPYKDNQVPISQTNWSFTLDPEYTDFVTTGSTSSEKHLDNYKNVNGSFIVNYKYKLVFLYGSLKDENNNYVYNDNNGNGVLDDGDTYALNTESVPYIAYRYKDMDDVVRNNKVVKPQAEVVDLGLNTDLAVNKRLRGQIVTNYLIEAVRFKINNSTYYVYPNQTNLFSLYYDTPSEIKNAISAVDFSNSFNISVGIKYGPKISAVQSSIGADSDGFVDVINLSDYDVTFNLNGGKINNSSIYIVKVPAGSKVSRPTDPIKSGFAFAGWYSDATLTTPFDFDNTYITGDTTIYAKYVEQYTLKVQIASGHESKGVVHIDDDTTVTELLVNKGSSHTIYALSNSGYMVDKWELNSSVVSNSYKYTVSNITSDMTFTAYYKEALTYTVSFDANGGSGGQSEDITVMAGGPMPTINTTPPTKEGYTFLGWYTAANYQIGEMYYTAAGESAHNYMLGANSTLYAGWVLDPPAFPTIKGGKETVYNYDNQLITLTCSTTSTYIDGVNIYYQFGYYTTDPNNITWVDEESTNNQLQYSKTAFKEYRYYVCSAKVSDDSQVVGPVVSTNTAVVNITNARVDFKANGGTITGTTKQYVEDRSKNFYTTKYGSTLSSGIPTASKEGFVFNGWFTSSSGGKMVIDAEGNIIPGISNRTNSDGTWKFTSTADAEDTNALFAQYVLTAPAAPTISGSATKVSGHENVTLTCTTTTNYGDGTDIYYQFGYATSANGTVTWGENATTTKTYSVDKNSYLGNRYYACRIYASDGTTTSNIVESTNKEVVSYVNARIDFDAQGGTLNGTSPVYASYGSNEVYVGRNTKATSTIPTASKEDSSFAGWYKATPEGYVKVIEANGGIIADVDGWTDSEGNWTLTSIYDSSGTNKLYAKYTKEVCSVLFETDGGGVSTRVSVRYGETVTRPDDPYKPGFRFIGWTYGYTGDLFDFDTPIIEDATLVARYQKEYTLTVKTNPTTCKIKYNNTEYSSGKTFALIDKEEIVISAVECEGYSFEGASSSDATVTSSGALNRIIKMSNKDATVTFNYIEDAVSFDIDITDGVSDKSSALEGETITITANEPEEGKRFDKWVVISGGVTLEDETSEETTFVMGNSDVSIKATYEDIPTYTVTFNTNGGTSIDEQIIEENGKVAKPNDPTKEGYDFKGWYTEKTFEHEYDFNKKVTSDLTLYAKFTKKKKTYNIISVENQKFNVDENEDLVVTADGEFTNFIGVRIDDKIIDSSKYVAESGSTIITMNQSFLKTLANGKHTMTIVYEDGSVTTDFTISNSPTIEKNPKTTDFGTTTILLIVIGIIGFIVLYVTRSQKSIMINK